MTDAHPADDGRVTVTDLGRVRVLTLDRPHRRNALSPALFASFEKQLARAAVDDDVRIVIVTGAGTTFCAGLDLQAYFDTGADRTATGRLLRGVAAFPKPIIAAVNGAAITGGFELALNCDFIVAARSATFRDTHSLVGAYAGGGMIGRLPAGVGIRNAKMLSFTGEPLTAEWAHSLGLVSKLADDGEALNIAVEMATKMAEVDPVWMRNAKEAYEANYRSFASAGVEAEFVANVRGRWRVVAAESDGD